MITIEMMGVRMGIETIINFGHIAVGRALPAVSFLIGGYHSPNRFPHFYPMDDIGERWEDFIYQVLMLAGLPSAILRV